MAQEDLEPDDPPASASHIAGIQTYTTTFSAPIFSLYKIVMRNLLTIISEVFTLFLPFLIGIHSSVSLE